MRIACGSAVPLFRLFGPYFVGGNPYLPDSEGPQWGLWTGMSDRGGSHECFSDGGYGIHRVICGDGDRGLSNEGVTWDVSGMKADFGLEFDPREKISEHLDYYIRTSGHG